MVQKPEKQTGAAPIDGRQARAIRTRAALLAAAERVIGSDGVGALTLERVAEEAGVSKGGLLYHFASKHELVGALLLHTLEGAGQRLNQLAGESVPGAFSRAYLDYVRTGEHARRGAAVGIFASAALDEGELAPAQAQFAVWQERLTEHDGIDSTVAMLTRIVGDGLWLIDLFGLAPPSGDQREAVLDLVQDLIEADLS